MTTFGDNVESPVLQLRVALTAQDYKRVLAFYQDALGLSPVALWENDGGHAVMFEMGQGTLEIFDEQQASAIDRLEAGERISGQIRFALQVPDLEAAVKRAVSKGATLVHEPVMTPWGDYNVRLSAPDGMQITLFQTLDRT
jgi:predicted enzyme related to lactoylglutathione lyase